MTEIQTGQTFGNLKAVVWDPTDRMELVWPGQSRLFYLLAASWGLPPGIALVSLLSPYWPLLAPVALAICCAVPIGIDWWYLHRKRFEFDVKNQQLHWQIGGRTGSAGFDAIEGFRHQGLLRATGTTKRHGARLVTNYFSGRLDICLSGRWMKMADSFEELRPEVEPYAELLQLQQALAEILGVSTIREDYRKGGIGWVIRRLRFSVSSTVDSYTAADAE